MDSQWGLNDSKCPQLFRTLLSILDDLNIAVVSMVFTRSLISKSSSPCNNLWLLYSECKLQLVSPSLPCFIVFLDSLASTYLSFAFLLLYPVISQKRKVHNSAGSLFLLTLTRSCCLAEIKLFVCISKSQRSLGVSFSRRTLACADTICLYGQI